MRASFSRGGTGISVIFMKNNNGCGEIYYRNNLDLKGLMI